MSAKPVRGWAAALLTAVILLVLPIPAWFIERFYSRGLFRYIQAVMTSISNLIPLAILDVLLLGAAVLVIWRTVTLFRVARTTGIFGAVLEGVLRLIRAASIVAIVFVCFWGLNYRRTPLAQVVRTAREAPTVAELQAVIADANSVAARLRPASSWAADRPSYEEIDRQLRAPMNEALQRLGRPPLTTPGRPKYSLVLTPFFTWAGVNGMVDPIALESIVHPDLLPFERPFVLAHEWAHLAGQADESEASAVGWLACMHGGAEMAYSASLYLIIEAGAALPSRLWIDQRRHLDLAVQTDLDALARRQQRERPAVRRAAFRVYDQYLRANHVEDGVTSYSRALSLILAPMLHDALASYRVNRDAPAPR